MITNPPETSSESGNITTATIYTNTGMPIKNTNSLTTSHSSNLTMASNNNSNNHTKSSHNTPIGHKVQHQVFSTKEDWEHDAVRAALGSARRRAEFISRIGMSYICNYYIHMQIEFLSTSDFSL